MKIHIKRYPVFIRMGCFAEERLAGQEVLVSVRLDMGAASPRDDDLSTTIDYGEVLEAIDAELADRELRLLESAVQALGYGLLKRFPVLAAAEVCIEKPRLPGGIGRGARVSISHCFLKSELGARLAELADELG